jgi:hypothetical protein
MAKEKKLTKAEHLEMELNSEQLNNVKLQKEIMLEKKQVKLLKIKIAELENQRTIQALNNTLDNMEVKIKRAEEEVAKFNQKLKDKYKIKSSFGINPDTGIILEE